MARQDNPYGDDPYGNNDKTNPYGDDPYGNNDKTNPYGDDPYGNNAPRNKIGYENEPNYSTLEGAQAEDKGGSGQASARDRAESSLQNAESAATGAKDAASAAGKFTAGDYAGAAKDGLRAAKNFKNSTKGKKGPNKEEGVATSNLKKATPIIGILLLVGLPLLAVWSITIMPFHLIENIKKNLNSLFGANGISAEQSYIAMIDGNTELTEAINEGVGYDGISQEACDELYLANIEYYKANNIRGCIPTALQDQTENSPEVTSYFRNKLLEDAVFAANSSTSTSNPSAYAGAFKWTDRSGEVHMVGPEAFHNYFNTNTEFNHAITQGALAWTGTFSGWFDDMVGQLMKKLEITRSSFQDYYEDISDQLKSKEAYRDIIEAINSKKTISHSSNEKLVTRNGTRDNEKGLSRRRELDEQHNAGLIGIPNKFDEKTIFDSSRPESDCPASWDFYPYTRPHYYTVEQNGHITYIYYGCTLSTEIKYDTTADTIVSEKIDAAASKVETYLPEMAKSFKTITNRDTCAQLYGVSYFSVIVAANRLSQATTFAAQSLEAIDKVKAGDGVNSPIHQLANQLSSNQPYTYLENGTNTSGLDSSIRTSSTNRSALNSRGLSWINTGLPIDTADEGVMKLSVEGVMKGFILDASIVASCNATTIIGDTLFGLVSLIIGRSHSNFDANDNAMLNIGETFINQAIRQAAFALVFNPCTTDAEGNLAMNEDVGNCIALGAHNYLSQNHRLAGGSPADIEKLKQFVEKHRRVVAADAARDRANRSPFDISSPNTFLGSIVNQISPYAASLTSSSLFTSISSIVGSSINSILPSASALEQDTMLGNIGDCKLLAGLDPTNSNGAVGDAYCVPYIITDIALFDPDLELMTPREIEGKVDELKGFIDEEDEGRQTNRVIDPKSNLARYIKYCSNRISIFGVIDANILKDHLESLKDPDPGFFGKIWAFINDIINSFGQLWGFYQPLQDPILKTALAWATGANCVATDNPNIGYNDIPDSDKNFWNDQGRYYQAYMTYQRINVNRASGEGNNALSTIQTWEAEHPIDTPEDAEAGQLGMLTEDYVLIKNYLAYQIIDKSTFGPHLATIAPANPIPYRRSITPLTDFIIENILPLYSPNTDNSKQQGTTA